MLVTDSINCCDNLSAKLREHPVLHAATNAAVRILRVVIFRYCKQIIEKLYLVNAST